MATSITSTTPSRSPADFAPEVVGIYETCAWLERKGVKNTRGMNKGGSLKSSGVTFTMTHAVHSCGILDEGEIVYGGEAAGYVLRFADGRALYFAGDTNVFSDMHLIEQLYHPELAFLPIGDLFTMSPHEAALACRLLRSPKVIPMHFGTFPPLTGKPEDLAKLLDRQRHRRLAAGAGQAGGMVDAGAPAVVFVRTVAPAVFCRRCLVAGA